MSNIILYSNSERTELFGSGTVGSLSSLFYPDFSACGTWRYGTGEDEIKVWCFRDAGVHTFDPNGPTATSIFSLAQAAVLDDEIHTLYLQSGAKFVYKHSSNGAYDPAYNRLTIYPIQIIAGGSYHDVTINDIPADDCVLDYERSRYALEGIYICQCEHPDFEYLRQQGLPQPKVACIGAKLIDRNTGSVGPIQFIRGYEINVFEMSDTERYTPIRTSRKGGGGRGVYPSTAAEQPNTAARNSWFSWSSGNGYGICYYVVDASTLSNYLAYIYSQGLLRDHQLYRDATIGAYKLPVTPPTMSSLGIIYVANLSMASGVSQADPISQRFVEGGTGVINISGYGYDTFADYTDTTMCLYLPFYGQINLDVNAFAQGSIEIKWLVDCYNGNICYWVYAQGAEDPRMILYGTYSGNCAIEIPIVGSGASGTVLGKITNLAGTLAVGAAKGAAAGLLAGAGSASTIANSQTVDRAGTIDANANASCPYAITLQVSHTVMLTPSGYREQLGIPSASPGLGDPETVSGFSGYTRFVNFHADHISGATDSEKAEIERLMNGGVFV